MGEEEWRGHEKVAWGKRRTRGDEEEEGGGEGEEKEKERGRRERRKGKRGADERN